MATATKSTTEQVEDVKPAVFYSRFSKLRLPRIKQVMRQDQLGQSHTHVFFADEDGREVSRRFYQFDRGVLTTTTDGKPLVPGTDMYPDGPGGAMQDAITWLRNHPEYNKGFHEDGREPDRPLPSDPDFHQALRKHLVALDEPAVSAMLAQERETHNRDQLVKAADQVRREILQLRQDLGKE